MFIQVAIHSVQKRSQRCFDRLLDVGISYTRQQVSASITSANGCACPGPRHARLLDVIVGVKQVFNRSGCDVLSFAGLEQLFDSSGELRPVLVVDFAAVASL